ncbi:MAG: hypothetical protein GWP14_01575 [Actinobacteria bacterium]|nr:hypothetical protein [Actinomycetota bacterium]
MKKCPGCRSFREHSQAIADQLREESQWRRLEVSAELHTKIMGRVREDSAAARGLIDARRLWLRLAPVVATAAVLLTIVAVNFYRGTEPKQPRPVRMAVNGTNPVVWIITGDDFGAESASLVETALQWPMQEEIRLLGQDGKAAAEFLLACVPLDIDTLVENDRP